MSFLHVLHSCNTERLTVCSLPLCFHFPINHYFASLYPTGFTFLRMICIYWYLHMPILSSSCLLFYSSLGISLLQNFLYYYKISYEINVLPLTKSDSYISLIISHILYIYIHIYMHIHISMKQMVGLCSE